MKLSSEDDFKKFLSQFNLQEGLRTCGIVSSYIYHEFNDTHNQNSFANWDKEREIFIHQSSLAYIANMLLMSKASDLNVKYFGDYSPNILTWLTKQYTENLIDFTKTINVNSFKPYCELGKMMLFFYTTQFRFQMKKIRDLICQCVLIYDRLMSNPEIFDLCEDKSKIDNPYEVFKLEADLSIKEYIFGAYWLAFVARRNQATVITPVPTSFIDEKLQIKSKIFTSEGIELILGLLSRDYGILINTDRTNNANLAKINTKLRFNPLEKYPIVKIPQIHGIKTHYIIPNFSLYYLAAFEGLYWWFVDYYKKAGQQATFMKYFGVVIEEYVGLLLKKIFGENKVHSGNYDHERKSGKKRTKKRSEKFVDWYIELGDKAYLIEVKAARMPQKTIQNLDRGYFDAEIEKIRIDQLCDWIKKIRSKQYPDLLKFADKKPVPIIITYGLDFLSMSIEEGRNIFTDYLQDKDPETLAKSKEYGIRIGTVLQIEMYFDSLRNGLKDKNGLQLEDIFPTIDEPTLRATSQHNQKLLAGNSFFHKVFEEFMAEFIEQKINIEVKH